MKHLSTRRGIDNIVSVGLLASIPGETKGLDQGSINRVGGDVTASLPVGRVAHLESRVDVKNRVGTARAERGRVEIELIAISISVTGDGTLERGAGSCLL